MRPYAYTHPAGAGSDSSMKPIEYAPFALWIAPITSGGTKPPRPPVAPVIPVTLPTFACGVICETRAKTLPLAVPRPAAMQSSAIVPPGTSAGSKAWTTAVRAAGPSAAAVTRAGWTRSESWPPTGRKRP